MRKMLVVATTTAVVGVLAGLGAPAADAQNVTFSLTGGSLAVAEPGTAAAITGGALAGLAGSALTGSLGSTTVTDQRGGTTGWSSKVTGTSGFTNGTTTIPVTAATVWVPGVISTSGVVVATAGTYLTQLTGLALTGSAQSLVTASAVVGNNSATFSPSIAVTIPSNATAGDYTGVVTQTVS